MSDAVKTIRQPKAESKEARLRAMREDKGKRKKISVPVIAEKMVTEMKTTAAAVTTTTPDSLEVAAEETKLAKKSNTKKAKAAKAKARTKVSGKTSGVKPGTKLAKVAEMLTRPGGCTAEQVKKACEWPSVSMPQQAKAAGLKLKKEKVDGVTRYTAEAA